MHAFLIMLAGFFGVEKEPVFSIDDTFKLKRLEFF